MLVAVGAGERKVTAVVRDFIGASWASQLWRVWCRLWCMAAANRGSGQSRRRATSSRYRSRVHSDHIGVVEPVSCNVRVQWCSYNRWFSICSLCWLMRCNGCHVPSRFTAWQHHSPIAQYSCSNCCVSDRAVCAFISSLGRSGDRRSPSCFRRRLGLLLFG